MGDQVRLKFRTVACKQEWELHGCNAQFAARDP